MKKIYSLWALILLLFAASGCEEDYRSMVLFTGPEPIYQVGTCDNLISGCSFFLTEAEDLVVGIDGGDGNYRLINEHESVATAAFTDDANGYRRIKIHPSSPGETVVKVMDGEGDCAQLHVTVKNRREAKLEKMAFEFGISADEHKELLDPIASALDKRAFVQNGGYYLLVPDGTSYLQKGVLEIYPTGSEKEPLIGRYDTVPVEGEDGNMDSVWLFTYGDEKRLYYRTAQSEGGGYAKFILVEDITSACPSDLLPDGVSVIYREMFHSTVNWTNF